MQNVDFNLSGGRGWKKKKLTDTNNRTVLAVIYFVVSERNEECIGFTVISFIVPFCIVKDDLSKNRFTR